VSAGLFDAPGVALARIPVADLALLVVAVGVAMAVTRAVSKWGRAQARIFPLCAAVLLVTVAVWIRAHGGLDDVAVQAAVLAVVATLLAWYLAIEPSAGTPVAGPRAPGRPAQEGPTRLRDGRRALVAAALIVAGGLLAWRLTTFAASTLVWESPVVAGFGEAFHAGTGPLAYTLRTLAWNDGLVSNGNASLLYGAPTYALLTHAGFSILWLRLSATVASLLLVAALWALATRHWGPAVGGVAALVAALNTYVIFYGKYGTSLAATMLACVAAAYAVGELAVSEAARWWHGLVAGLVLFAATLEYSPGRLVVVVLLASLIPALVGNVRRRRWRTLAAFTVLTVVAAAAVVAQRAVGTERFFLHARGEQLFTMLRQEDYLRAYLARPSPAFDAFTRWAARLGLLESAPATGLRTVPGPGGLDRHSPAVKFEVTFKVLAETVPQCVRLLSPFALFSPTDQSIFDDPPGIKPYFAPLAAFTLLGLAVSLRRFRRWGNAVLLAWFALTVGPVLLTTRFDAHRVVLVAVPLCVWTALGLVEAGNALRRLGVSHALTSALGATTALVLFVGIGAVVLRQKEDDGAQQRILTAIQTLPGPLVVGALIDHRQRAWIELGLLERSRRDPGAGGRLLAADLREAPTQGDGRLSPDLVKRFRLLCANATVVLTPADAYSAVAAQMKVTGLEVTEMSEPGLSAWLLRRPP
jgi:hypothetical protein